ncbi:MAG: cytochrome c oxidase assembly protein [Dehalococcoidia bacterium]
MPSDRVRLTTGVGILLAAAGSLAGSVSPAYAHNAGTAAEAARTWDFSGPLILLIGSGTLAYHAGLRSLANRSNRGNQRWLWTEALGLLGILFIVAALVSPIDALGELSASVHMEQHMLLLLLAPACLILGKADVALPALLPRSRTIRRLERRTHWLAHPLATWFIFAAVFWAWHLPVMYEFALHNPLIHELEHATMFTAGLLWFRVALRYPGRKDFGFGESILWVVTTGLQMSALTALMAFSEGPWYADYANNPGAWIINSTTDQQLAGVVAWAAATPILLALVAWMFARWFAVEERRARAGQEDDGLPARQVS